MGVEGDPGAVVTSDLRLRGIEALRLVDASVIPTIVSGNTNAAVLVVAEKAAEFILGRSPREPARLSPVDAALVPADA
jgi:choline dehydrogenase